VNDPDELITVVRKRWQWDQHLLSLSRYVAILRGDFDIEEDDLEWVNSIAASVEELRDDIEAGGNARSAASDS
jgi:hypothetical protein